MRSTLLTLALLALAASLLAAGCGGGTSTSPTSTAASAAAPLAPATAAASAVVGVPPLWFVDADHGWTAVGADVLATSDGGRTWDKRGSLRAAVSWLDLTSTDRGWAATDQGLFRTDDGGATWQAVGEQRALTWVQFVDDSRGWVAGPGTPERTGAQAPFLLSTDNGGQTWIARTDPCQPVSDGGFFFSFLADSGWALCTFLPGSGMQGKRLFTSTDGGDNWALVAEADLGSPGARGDVLVAGVAQDLFFLTPQRGWMSTNRLGLAATNDGGATWRKLPNVYWQDQFLARVVFISAERGWVLSSLTPLGPSDNAYQGGFGLFGTTDGGQTWQQLCVGDFLACGR